MAKHLEFNTEEFRKEMVDVSNGTFGGGINIKYPFASISGEKVHPSGYDFLSFGLIEIEDEEDEDYVENYKFSASDFSFGIYDRHPLEGKTLKEILDIIGENNWEF